MKLFELSFNKYGESYYNYLFYKPNTTDQAFQLDVELAIKSIDIDNTNEVIDMLFITNHVVKILCEHYEFVETSKVIIQDVDLIDSKSYFCGSSNKHKVLTEALEKSTILNQVFSTDEIAHIIDHNCKLEEKAFEFRVKRLILSGSSYHKEFFHKKYDLTRIEDWVTADRTMNDIDSLIDRITKLYEYRDNNYFGFDSTTNTFNGTLTLDILNDLIESLIFEDIDFYDTLEMFQEELITYNKILTSVFEYNG